MGTITLEITGESTSELIKILNFYIENVEGENIENIATHVKLDSDSLEEEKEQYCYVSCQVNKKDCVCFQESLGCDKYHQKREEGQL